VRNCMGGSCPFLRTVFSALTKWADSCETRSYKKVKIAKTSREFLFFNAVNAKKMGGI
jgi:hypothetical protein